MRLRRRGPATRPTARRNDPRNRVTFPGRRSDGAPAALSRQSSAEQPIGLDYNLQNCFYPATPELILRCFLSRAFKTNHTCVTQAARQEHPVCLNFKTLSGPKSFPTLTFSA